MDEYASFMRNNFMYWKLTTFDEMAWTEFEICSLSQYVSLNNKGIIHRDVYEDRGSKRDPYLKKRSFKTWLEDVKRQDRLVPNDSRWKTFHSVQTRLLPDKKGMGIRRNADLREFRVYHDVYMVRNYFSFGFQTVRDGCYHVIVSANKHLDLYIAKSRKFFEDGKFPYECMGDFDEVTVIPKSLKIMVPGEQYLLIAPLKTIFYYKVCASWKEYQQVVHGIKRVFNQEHGEPSQPMTDSPVLSPYF